MPGVPSKLSRKLANVRVQLKTGKTRGVYPRALKKHELEALRVREQKLTAGMAKAALGGQMRATASRGPGVAAAEAEGEPKPEARKKAWREPRDGTAAPRACQPSTVDPTVMAAASDSARRRGCSSRRQDA